MSLREFLKRQEEQDFTPEKKRDAAKMLRSWKGRGKSKATKYAELLEMDAAHDTRTRAIIREEMNKPYPGNNYMEDQ